LLQEVIEQVNNVGTSVKDKVFENIALTIANKAAIPYGRQLSDEEMRTLYTDWSSIKNNKYTPTGKQVVNILTNEQVNKMF